MSLAKQCRKIYSSPFQCCVVFCFSSLSYLFISWSCPIYNVLDQLNNFSVASGIYISFESYTCWCDFVLGRMTPSAKSLPPMNSKVHMHMFLCNTLVVSLFCVTIRCIFLTYLITIRCIFLTYLICFIYVLQYSTTFVTFYL